VASMPLAPPFTKGLMDFHTVLFLGASPILAPLPGRSPAPDARAELLHALALASEGPTAECCHPTSALLQFFLLCGLQNARAIDLQGSL
jgi:hypothetical protein